MITLATLHLATAQEVFDQVATHLLTQNAKSVKGSGCAYRGDGGMKCAAGCLIADDEYKPEMETASWQAMVRPFNMPGTDPYASIRNLAPNNHCTLIMVLQQVHDINPPSDWPRRLASIARSHGLEYNHV